MSVVGNLVANLTANISGFTKPLGVARGQLGSFVGAARSSAGMLAGAVAGVGAPLAAAFGIGKSVAAFREAEQAGKKLDAALGATGGSAGVTAGEIKTLAGDLQKVTNFEDDATIAASALLAKFTNIKGDVFKQAIVSAADFSSLTGKDLPASINLIGRALNDPLKGMQLLKKSGVQLTEEQQNQVKALTKANDLAGAQGVILGAIQSRFGGAAEAMADPLTILGNMAGDFAEGIGSLVLPSLQELASFITDNLVPGSGTLTEKFTEWGIVLKGWVNEALNFVSDGITVIGFGIENFGSLAELAFKSASLSAVTFVNDVVHFFTSTIPTAVQWFGQNFVDVFYTAFDLWSTAFINHWTNIKNLMVELWDFIASGGGDAIEVSWEPLTKGFVNTIKKLPDFADRIPTDLEKSLLGDVASLQDGLSEDLGNVMVNSWNAADEKVKPLAPDFMGNITGEAKAAAQKEAKGAGVETLGSKEAFSSIFKNMRGDDLQAQMLKLQEDANRLQEDQNALLEELVDQEEEVVEF